jgi:hypothetical protein
VKRDGFNLLVCQDNFEELGTDNFEYFGCVPFGNAQGRQYKFWRILLSLISKLIDH